MFKTTMTVLMTSGAMFAALVISTADADAGGKRRSPAFPLRRSR